MYKVICYCGIGFITYIDKFAVLEKLAEYDRGAASKCTFYFTFSLLCMLLGIVAASFPETAPFAMKISWNGSLQAFLFVIAYLHLSAIEYYAHVQQMFISFIITSTLFSLLWYFFTMDVDRSERRYSK